tara:strand:+ start:418 stop:570 length:153 start_codon:yes stop_codon:yes gene_type:complete
MCIGNGTEEIHVAATDIIVYKAMIRHHGQYKTIFKTHRIGFNGKIVADVS